ncbi:hypothetical protein [Vibrio phage V-YDF132]|nr:hypothetical protein [Vibrio phage V-YDF132]
MSKKVKIVIKDRYPEQKGKTPEQVSHLGSIKKTLSSMIGKAMGVPTSALGDGKNKTAKELDNFAKATDKATEAVELLGKEGVILMLKDLGMSDSKTLDIVSKALYGGANVQQSTYIHMALSPLVKALEAMEKNSIFTIRSAKVWAKTLTTEVALEHGCNTPDELTMGKIAIALLSVKGRKKILTAETKKQATALVRAIMFGKSTAGLFKGSKAMTQATDALTQVYMLGSPLKDLKYPLQTQNGEPLGWKWSPWEANKKSLTEDLVLEHLKLLHTKVNAMCGDKVNTSWHVTYEKACFPLPTGEVGEYIAPSTWQNGAWCPSPVYLKAEAFNVDHQLCVSLMKTDFMSCIDIAAKVNATVMSKVAAAKTMTDALDSMVGLHMALPNKHPRYKMSLVYAWECFLINALWDEGQIDMDTVLALTVPMYQILNMPSAFVSEEEISYMKHCIRVAVKYLVPKGKLKPMIHFDWCTKGGVVLQKDKFEIVTKTHPILQTHEYPSITGMYAGNGGELSKETIKVQQLVLDDRCPFAWVPTDPC